ncbi:12070_t:CDS:1 [Acaulospora colombiana]|uniref:12070_t:CDS:1 n=1 Tax=Acaulospora colombiana TaxID=27376 RepID=A0ACA9M0D8_9GLOM|nr:12070_t:CDS:1 [Acaulospora colombiana]
MEAVANALNLDFDFFEAISKDDYKTLNEYESDLAPPQKACYVSHYKVWQLVAQRNSSALILEDDVDFEMNISSVMLEILRILPADWEMLYLGHCSQEDFGEPLGESSGFKLFKSTRPSCTHAYAVSSSGAAKLLELLVNPKMPVDVELVFNIEPGKIISYSIEPPLIAQWKSPDNPSDISPGAMDEMQHLQNSTLHYLGLS